MDGINQALKLAKSKEYVEMLSVLETLSPSDFRKFCAELFGEEAADADYYEEIRMALTGEQFKRFKWLDSSEREVQYILEKAQQGEFTEEDNRNLRACDF